MSTVIRGKIMRSDLANWDGKTATATRPDATGGTITGLAIGNEVDVLQVFGDGNTANQSLGTITNAIQTIGSTSVTLAFLPGTWTIDDDLTIPANFACYIPSGCLFDIAAGKTLTFNGAIYADSATFSSGSGTVDVVANSIVAGKPWIARTAAERSKSITPTDYQYEAGNVLRYGTNTIPGTTDMQSAFNNAQLQMQEVGGANITIPPDIYLMGSQWTITAPSDKRCSVHGYGAEIKTSGTISAVQLTGGSSTGGCTIFGLQVNHRGNAAANFGFELHTTWNARLVDCSVEAHDTKAGYASYILRNGTAANDATGCFWTLLEHCQNRRVTSGDGTQVEAALRLRGAANATVVRDCNLGDAVTCVHITIESGQTTVANALLVIGCAFEGYTTAIHTEGAATSNLAGNRYFGNRFESGTTVFSITGITAQPSQPDLALGNMLVSNAGTYLNNPNSLYFNAFDLSVTPDGSFSLIQEQDITFRSLAEDFKVAVKTGKGIELTDASDNSLFRLDARVGSGSLISGVQGIWVKNFQGISGTATEAKNLRGTVTFATAATATVTFGTAEPDAAYFISISGGANETFWVTSKATTGFTMNSSNATSTAVVDWVLIR